MIAVSFHNISKKFNDKSVLNNLNFDVRKGEIVALLGPSGCGKTTTLRMIAGFEKPTDGEMQLGKKTITTHQDVPVHERNIGMVFQEYALFPHLTVEENIRFGLQAAKNCDTLVQNMLKLVNLEGYEKRFPHELSGGQQQRIAIARALAPSPDVLLLDEPFSNLDTELTYVMRFEIQRIIKQAKTTAIFVTHNQKDALAIADRIIVMNDGNIEQIGSAKEVYREPATPFVAQFISRSNMIPGTANGKEIQTPIGKIALCESVYGEGYAILRRDEIALNPSGAFSGTVRYCAFFGEYYELTVKINGFPLRIHLPGNNERIPSIGETISFDLKECWFVQEADCTKAETKERAYAHQ
ncbi:MAG: ABC transporter ATP-binding protein [Bacilli bacterium]